MKEEYSTVEGVCPHCGSSNVEWEGYDNDGERLYYRATCNVCGCEFLDVFTIVFEKKEVTKEGRVV